MATQSALFQLYFQKEKELHSFDAGKTGLALLDIDNLLHRSGDSIFINAVLLKVMNFYKDSHYSVKIEVYRVTSPFSNLYDNAFVVFRTKSKQDQKFTQQERILGHPLADTH